jgi:hypothetical protein
MAGFILFGTEGCHLCEEAEQLLVDAGIAHSSKDIMNHEEWHQQYGLLIPVLWHAKSRRQLNWPFDARQLQHFTESVILESHPQ